MFGLGISAKLFDIYTKNFADIFSQMSIWIFLGTLFSIYSSSPKRAGINVFIFSVGMLASYYVTAVITDSVYSAAFICGWSIFALLLPTFAFLTWYVKGKGWFAKVIALGILAIMVMCAIILFDKIRFSDVVIITATALILFTKKQ